MNPCYFVLGLELIMNRLFHAKIQKSSWLLLMVLLVLAVFAMWNKSPILMAIAMLLMVVIIERMIHTTYTIDKSGNLIIHKGRFSKDKIISLKDIQRIDRVNSMRIFGKSISTCLFIVCNEGRQIQVIPRLEDEFVECVRKRRLELDNDKRKDENEI